MSVFVVDPAFPFALLATRVEAGGWERVPDEQGDKEPDIAAWTRGGERLTYAFNPAIGLRTLAGAEGPDGVPLLDVETVRALIADADAATALHGLAAARAAGAVGLLPGVLARVGDDDELVSKWATEAALALSAAGLAASTGAVRTERARRPGRSVLYAGFPCATRLQVLRWWLELRPPPEPGVVEFLRAALADADWELRVTALLACGRLRVAELAGAAARAALPEGVRDGVLPRERELLVAARALIGAGLRATLPGAERSSPGAERSSRLARAIFDGAIDGADVLARLLTTLTVPVPEASEPDSLPTGVVDADGAYRLAGTDVELVWVPPVVHWLGDVADTGGLPNPLRRVTPAVGCFVARESSPAGMTFAAAVAACAVLAARSGAAVELPTADAWELAARGPDARRYASGNVPAACATTIPEWTRTVTRPEHRAVCAIGAPCAHRVETAETSVEPRLRPMVLAQDGPSGPAMGIRAMV